MAFRVSSFWSSAQQITTSSKSVKLIAPWVLPLHKFKEGLEFLVLKTKSKDPRDFLHAQSMNMYAAQASRIDVPIILINQAYYLSWTQYTITLHENVDDQRLY